MVDVPVSREAVRWPNFGVSTIIAGRVCIDAVDVVFTRTCSRSKTTQDKVVVVDERDPHSSFSEFVDEMLIVLFGPIRRKVGVVDIRPA